MSDHLSVWKREETSRIALISLWLFLALNDVPERVKNRRSFLVERNCSTGTFEK